MVFDATINNISVISWQSVLLVEETGVPRENHPPVASHWQRLVCINFFFISLKLNYLSILIVGILLVHHKELDVGF
jgi:hypothetical protein